MKKIIIIILVSIIVLVAVTVSYTQRQQLIDFYKKVVDTSVVIGDESEMNAETDEPVNIFEECASDYETSLYVPCVIDSAYASNDVSMCEFIADDGRMKACKNTINYKDIKNTSDVSKCFTLSQEGYKLTCIDAMLKNDRSLCNTLENDEQIEECFYRLEIIKGEPK